LINRGRFYPRLLSSPIEPENYKVMAEAGPSKRNQRTRGKASSSKPSNVGVSGKPSLKDIAASTLKNIEHGSYEVDGISYDLKEKIDLLKANTTYYAADSDLSEWSTIPQTLVDSASKVRITVCEYSTLTGARKMKECLQSPTESPEVNSASVKKKVGVLSFGSAKNPGGGFINGAQAQVHRRLLFFRIYALNNGQLHKRRSRSRAHQPLYPV
jgi:hypothetical protein